MRNRNRLRCLLISGRLFLWWLGSGVCRVTQPSRCTTRTVLPSSMNRIPRIRPRDGVAPVATVILDGSMSNDVLLAFTQLHAVRIGFLLWNEDKHIERGLFAGGNGRNALDCERSLIQWRRFARGEVYFDSLEIGSNCNMGCGSMPVVDDREAKESIPTSVLRIARNQISSLLLAEVIDSGLEGDFGVGRGSIRFDLGLFSRLIVQPFLPSVAALSFRQSVTCDCNGTLCSARGSFGGCSLSICSFCVVPSYRYQSESTKRLNVFRPVLFGFFNLVAGGFIVIGFAIFVSFDRWRQGWLWGIARCIGIVCCWRCGQWLIWQALSLYALGFG